VDHAHLDHGIDGILRYAIAHDDLAELLRRACETLTAAGVQVWRGSLDIPTIDPDARAMAHKWWSDRPLSIEPLPHGPEQEGVFRVLAGDVRRGEGETIAAALDQYKANKETGANGGLKWVEPGGGYFSACNNHLKLESV
jgi:hypothetical protein